jgi:hypothetical protein
MFMILKKEIIILILILISKHHVINWRLSKITSVYQTIMW